MDTLRFKDVKVKLLHLPLSWTLVEQYKLAWDGWTIHLEVIIILCFLLKDEAEIDAAHIIVQENTQEGMNELNEGGLDGMSKILLTTLSLTLLSPVSLFFPLFSSFPTLPTSLFAVLHLFPFPLLLLFYIPPSSHFSLFSSCLQVM